MPLLEKLTQHRITLWRILFLALAMVYLGGTPAWSGTWIADTLRIVGLVLVAMAAMGRLWCALYISGRKNKELVVSGPYAICRHPLYFFNFIGMLGIAAWSESLLLSAIVALLFGLFYPAVLAYEEKLLAKNFPSYNEYKNRTPTFWPRISLHRAPETWVVNVRSFMRNVADSIWFFLCLAVIEIFDVARSRAFPNGYYELY